MPQNLPAGYEDAASTVNAARRLADTLHDFHDLDFSPQIVRTKRYCDAMYAAEDVLNRLEELGRASDRDNLSYVTLVLAQAHGELLKELEEEYDINYEDFGIANPCPPRFFIPGTETSIVISPFPTFISTAPIIAAAARSQFNLKLGGSVIDLPGRDFLGINNGSRDSLGLFSPDKKAFGFNVGASLRYDASHFIPAIPLNTDGTSSTYLKAGAFFSNAAIRQTGIALDPGAGNSLLIPGPQGGASGFSLGSYPLNMVSSGVYSAKLIKTGAYAGVGQSTHFANSVTMDTSASVGYTRTEFDEYFAGTISGFGRDFAYNSDASVDQIKLRLRLGLSKKMELSNGSTLTLGGFGALGPDLAKASGTDMLSFSGFPDSSASPGASRTALGYEAGASLGYKSQYGFTVGLNATYRRETAFPVFMRDGINPTVLCLLGGDKLDFNASFSVPFYSDVRLKRDIAPVARLDNGLKLYRYRYLWSDTVHVGVMAQEVALIRPDAVVRDAGGFLRVDYARLGLRMLTWREWQAARRWSRAAKG